MGILDFLKKKPITAYEQLGGEKAVHHLVDEFYRIMDSDPAAHAVRAVHPASLESAKLKLKEFLSGWLGGPSIYIEKYGHPRMRMRHMPFPISATERDQWLYCMHKAMDSMSVTGELRTQMDVAFKGLAEQIRNRE